MAKEAENVALAGSVCRQWYVGVMVGVLNVNHS